MTKRNLFKRTIAVLISVLMVLTSLPFTAFADDETIVWKFDASQATATAFSRDTAFTVVDSSNKNSQIQGIYWNSDSQFDKSAGYVHAEDAAISGGIGGTTHFGSTKLSGDHWIFQYRYAYLAQGHSGGNNTAATDNNNCSVFALGNNGANVVNITSDGNVYLDGSATATTQIDRTKFICDDKTDIRTAAFEYDHGTLTFSVKGETLFTTDNCGSNVANGITNFFMGASKVTTAGGTMQYVGPANTGNCIHGMYLYKLIGSVITESESSSLVKTGTLSPASHTLITGSGSRLDGSNWNIVNDQEAGNTSAGIVKYDIKDLKGKTARDSTLNVQLTSNALEDYQGLTFYWTTDSSKVEGLLNNGQQQGKISGTGDYGSGTKANQKVANTLGFNVDSNWLCSLSKSNNTTNTYTVDISAANLQKIFDANSDVVYIVCMMSEAGGKSGAPWSDTKVSPTSVKLNYVYEIPDAPKSDVVTALNAISNPTVKSSTLTESEDGSVKKNNLYSTDKMSNVLYMYGSGGNASFDGYGDSNWHKGGVQYGNMTFLDDGETDMGAPISIYIQSTTSWGNSRDVRPKTATTEAPFMYKAEWHSGHENNNAGYFTVSGNTMNYGQKSDNFADPTSQAVFKSGKTWRYSNTMYVDRTKITYGENYRYTNTSQKHHHYNNCNGSNDDRSFTYTKATIRVINYVPLADIIRGIKNQTLTEYKNIKDDPGYYTGATSINYLNALKDICDFDPNSYFGKSTNNYSDCCDEIARLLKNYNDAKDDLKLNTYTVTFRYNSGKELTKKVKRFGTVTCPNDDSPAVTSKYNADQHTITRYYWGPADLSITEDKVYNELSAVTYYNHEWVEDSRTPATCTEDGSVVSHCSVCEQTKTETLTKLGHAWNLESGTANYAADTEYDSSVSYTHKVTCTNNNAHTNDVACSFPAEWTVDGDIERKECSVCHGTITQPHIVGHTITFKNVDGTNIDIITTIDGETPNAPNLAQFAKIDADGHHSFSWDKALAPATEDTTYTLVENEVVPHAYSGDYTQTKAPTCSQEGIESRDCTVDADCTFKDTRPVEKLPHTFGDWIFNSALNKHHHICSVCDEDEYADCSFTDTVVKAPTCTEAGETLWTCTECGGSFKEYPLATGHDDVATLPITGAYEPSCTESGYTGDKVCTKCGTALESGTYIDPLGHDFITEYIKGTCEAVGTASKVCSRGDLDPVTYSFAGFEYRDVDPSSSAYIAWPYGRSENTYDGKRANFTYKMNLDGVEIDHMDITFTYYIGGTYVGSDHDHFSIIEGESNGTVKFNLTSYNTKEITDSVTVSGDTFTYSVYKMKKNDSFYIDSIKVYPKAPASQTQADYAIQEHNHQFRDNGDGATHTDYCLMTYSDGATQEIIHDASVAHSFTGESVHTDAEGDNNGYTEYYCASGCGAIGGRVYDELDWSSYDSVLEIVEYNKSRTDMYTADSITDYTKIVNAITTNVDKTDVTKSQTHIDNIVKAIDGCKSYLKLESYSVTFIYEVDGVPTTVKDEELIEYGTNVELKVPSGLGSVYKWSYEIGGNTTNQAISNESVTYIVAANTAIIIAYVDSGSSTVTGHSVKVYDKLGKLTDTKDVQDGNSINITEMNINTIAFYSITAYRVNGEEVSIDAAKNYAVTEDLEIQPVYSALGKEFTITPATDDITINKKSGAYKAAWDAKVTATAPDTNANTAWYVDNQLVGYGETYTFRATKSCTVRYENAQEAAGVSSLDFLDYGVYRNHGITVVGHYDVPEGATDVKYGVILKTVKNPADTSRQLTFAEITEGNKTGKKYATTLTDTDQYKIVVTRTANTPILIGAVAFVEYTINGESKVAYSAPQTIYGIN